MDALDRKQMMNEIMRRLGNRKKTPSQHGMMALRGGAYQPMAQTASQPTAAESQAFNERKKNRALYGKYGKGGLEREKISSEERIRQMMERGATGRTKISTQGDIKRKQIGAETQRKEAQLRYGEKTPLQPEGVERTRVKMIPKVAKIKQKAPKAPKVHMPPAPVSGGESQPFIVKQGPQGYYKKPLKGKPLSTEEQMAWQQYWRGLPAEEREKLMKRMGGGY